MPYDATISDVCQLKLRFPQVVFVDMGHVRTDAPSGSHEGAHELYDRRTAKGLSVAQGDILAILEDYGAPARGWCDQVIKAHRLPHGVIGGAVEHVGEGPLNWAVYLRDFGRYQLPLREGPADYLTDVNISYKREALELVDDLWADTYNEVIVNQALARRGVVLWMRPQIIVDQDRGRLSFPDLVMERYCWGRLFASAVAPDMSPVRRWLRILLSPAIPALLLARMACKVFGSKRHWAPFLLCLPHNVVLTSVWCLGELIGYATAQASPNLSPTGVPSRE